MKIKLLIKRILVFLSISLNLCLIFFIYQVSLTNKDTKVGEDSMKEEMDYLITKESYMDNTSYVEYPRIEGLKDEKKQDCINKLLKDRAFYGATTYMNEPFVDLSDPDCEYEFEYRVGFANNYIASFWYIISLYRESIQDNGIIDRNVADRYICMTIDMSNGEEINLSKKIYGS